MRNKAIFLAMILTLIVAACQQAPVIEYVKYEGEAGVPRISAEDAKKEYDAGNAVFVDSRGDAAWKAERLPGALSIQSVTDEKLATLPKGKKIITYCS